MKVSTPLANPDGAFWKVNQEDELKTEPFKQRTGAAVLRSVNGQSPMAIEIGISRSNENFALCPFFSFVGCSTNKLTHYTVMKK